MIDRLLSTIAPHSCYGCGEVGHVLCGYCMNDIKETPFERCVFCLRLTNKAALCSLCGERNHLLSAWCVGERTAALRTALDAYKFEHVKAAADTFAQLLHEITPLLDDDVIVTAIPTAPSHIRQRGYDHAELIARRFAKLRGLTYCSLLERTDMHTQHFATRDQRLRYADKAFRATQSAPQVFLIDDIVTSGATIQAAARELKRAGVADLHVGVIARQPLDENHHL